jgi:hypothetical protein
MGLKLQEVVLLLGLATVIFFSPIAEAQYPAGLSSTGPESAYRDRLEKESKAGPGKYTLKLGQVRFRVGLGMRNEYNDNIRLADGADQHGDVVTTPSVSVNALWPFSKLNTLDFTIGVEHSKYWNNPDLDTQSMIITPNSLADFNVYVGDIRFNLYDRISLQEDPISQPQLSGTSKFRRLENTIGLKAEWDLNKIIPTAGYEYHIFKALDQGSVTTDGGQTFGGLDHETSTIFLGLGYRVNPRMVAGVRTSFSETTYKGNQQNGSTSEAYALFLDGQVTQHISIATSVGYQIAEFSSGGAIGDNSGFESYIFSMSARHEMNRFYSHNLGLNRFEMPGIGTNFTAITEFNYGFTWDLIRDYDLTGNLFYQMYEDSGNGPASESGDRYGLALKVSHQLFKSWKMGIGYNLVVKESDLKVNDYMQNRVFLELIYSF